MLRRILLNAALNTFENLLMGLVRSADLKKVLDVIIEFVQEIVKVLTDNDKNNKDQVQNVWKNKRNEIAIAGVDLIELVIKEKITNPELQESALIQTKALREILNSILD